MSSPHSEFAGKISDTIAKYGMMKPDDRILVGVSGGADSVSLVRVLKELGYTVGMAHLHHGLRGSEADEDERFVADLSMQLGVPFFLRRIAISAANGNVEAAGHTARKEFFKSIAEDHGFTKIAVAHTRDDRVETCLLHLFRGAGLEGMVSMAPVSGITVRPLIETSHFEIHRFLIAAEQPWRTDSTNHDTVFARNRMRHEFLPKLAESFNPNLAETLSRTVELLQNEDAWMQELTSQWLAEHAVQANGEATVDAVALGAAPVALARRAIRSLFRQIGSDLTDLTFDHVESVRSLLAGGMSGKTIQVPGRMVAERAFDRIVFRQIPGPVKDFDYILPIPGTIHIPEIGMTFRAGVANSQTVPSGSQNRQWVFVDGGRLGPCVKIRNWKPGDYYKPVGWPGGKLKKLFQRARVPRSQRSRWPVFEIDSTLVWVASFPVSREFAPGGRSQKIVALEVLEVMEAISK